MQFNKFSQFKSQMELDNESVFKLNTEKTKVRISRYNLGYNSSDKSQNALSVVPKNRLLTSNLANLTNLLDIDTCSNDQEVVIIGGGITGYYIAITLRQFMFKGKITIYQDVKKKDEADYPISQLSKQDSDTKNLKINNMLNKKGTTIHELYLTLQSIIKSFSKIFEQSLFVDCLDSLAKLHSENCIFFHANGVHSMTRDNILNQEPILKLIYYTIHFSYKLSKTHPKILKFSDQLKIEKYLAGVAKCIESEVQNDELLVVFYIEDFVFEKLNLYTADKPGNYYDLVNTGCSDLVNAVTFYIRFRCFINKDKVAPGSFIFFGLPINLVKATSFAVKRNNQDHFIVGDAALSVPFYRGIRNLIVETNWIVSNLTGHNGANPRRDSTNLSLTKDKVVLNFDSMIDSYNNFMTQLSEEEYNIASRKLNPKIFKNYIVKFTNLISWELNEKSIAEVQKISLSL